MVKAIIIYESRWGNTRQVAEHIAEGMRQTRQTEVDLVEIGQVDLDVIVDFDSILIGCSFSSRRLSYRLLDLASVDLLAHPFSRERIETFAA